MLPPEVAEAIKQTEVTVEMFDTLVIVNHEHWDVLVVHLHRLAEENARLLGELEEVRGTLRVVMPLHEQAMAERDALKAFARDVMRAWPEGDVDGGELQEAALRHGLLEPSEPTQEERGEWGLVDGDLWYRKTALLKLEDGE